MKTKKTLTKKDKKVIELSGHYDVIKAGPGETLLLVGPITYNKIIYTDKDSPFEIKEGRRDDD